MEFFQLVLQTVFECKRNHPRVDEILDSWCETNRLAVELGKRLYKEQLLEREIDVATIYDIIINRYNIACE